MRSKFPGWYKPTPDELDGLWARGIVVLDANALLAPYRRSEPVRKDLFNVMEALRGQLWVPYQAALEYQQNRLKVVADQRAAYADIHKKVNEAEKALLARRADHPVIDPKGFEEVVVLATAAIKRAVDDFEAQHPEVLGNDRDDDSVRTRWDDLLEGRIGDRLIIDDKWRSWADVRYEAGIPPGFADSRKDKQARVYGDLIIWCELRARVKAHLDETGENAPVIFVTDDAKEDWWRKSDGQLLGPRPELTDELAESGGTPFWMYSVTRFVSVAAQRLGWEVAHDPSGGDDKVIPEDRETNPEVEAKASLEEGAIAEVELVPEAGEPAINDAND